MADVAHAAPSARPVRSIDAVVVGASAGGIDALLALFAGLPAGWRLPVVAVLHLPEGRDSRLVEVFARRATGAVVEAVDKARVAPGTLHFAPAGYHLSIERECRFSLSCEPPVRYSRPSIDVLMASAADAYGPRLAGVLLTGANDDGADGLARIHAAGGYTAVQDPATARVPTMPTAALARHRPDAVLSLPVLRALLIEMDEMHHGV